MHTGGEDMHIKKLKNYSTAISRVVTHHSTDTAITSLIAEIRRDPMFSGLYGRSYISMLLRKQILLKKLIVLKMNYSGFAFISIWIILKNSKREDIQQAVVPKFGKYKVISLWSI